MKPIISSLLKDKNVLLITAFLSVINLLAYLILKNYDAIIFFALVGLLTTYFSKNMIVILLVSLSSTLLFNSKPRILAGFGNGHFTTADTKEKAKENAKKNAEKKALKHKKSVDDDDDTNDDAGALDKRATFNESLGNIENTLSEENIEQMSNHTQMLAKRQDKLHSQINKMAPALEKSMKLLNDMGGSKGIEGMMDRVGGMMERFSGMTKDIKK